jgi:SAM-dependent methyltransferase
MSPEAEFDEFADTYADIISQGTSFFDPDHSYFPRLRANILKRFAGPKVDAVLDFGCGIGLGIGALREAFPNARIVGCDPSRRSLAAAQSREPNCEFLELNALQPTQEFDVITAASVFHHIEPSDRKDALRYCYERLKPGGRLFVFEHNPFNPITRRIVSNCPVDKGAILLTRKETIIRLRAARFTIDAKGYFLFFPRILAFLRPLEGSVRWLPLGGQYFVVGVRQ